MRSVESSICTVHRYVIGRNKESPALSLYIERKEIGENPLFTHGELARKGNLKNVCGGNLLIDSDEQLIHVEDSGVVSASDQRRLDEARGNGIFWV